MIDDTDPRIFEGVNPGMSMGVAKDPDAPVPKASVTPLGSCTARGQVVHVLRLHQPGATVNTTTIERHLPRDSWLWNRSPRKRRQAIRDSLTRLTFRQAGAVHHGRSEQVRVTWDPALYSRQTRANDIALHHDAGGKRGREPFPRCLVRVKSGAYEILPEVYEPQTDVERAFGVPEIAATDAPWPELTESETEAVLEAFPSLTTWPRLDLRRLVHTLRNLEALTDDQ